LFLQIAFVYLGYSVNNATVSNFLSFILGFILEYLKIIEATRRLGLYEPPPLPINALTAFPRCFIFEVLAIWCTPPNVIIQDRTQDVFKGKGGRGGDGAEELGHLHARQFNYSTYSFIRKGTQNEKKIILNSREKRALYCH
jgi:hypothetical protein